jgi:hypothetical protein
MRRESDDWVLFVIFVILVAIVALLMFPFWL